MKKGILQVEADCNSQKHTRRLYEIAQSIDNDVSSVQVVLTALQSKMRALQLEINDETPPVRHSNGPSLSEAVPKEAQHGQTPGDEKATLVVSQSPVVLQDPPALARRWAAVGLSREDRSTDYSRMSTKAQRIQLHARWEELHATAEEEWFATTTEVPGLVASETLKKVALVESLTSTTFAASTYEHLVISSYIINPHSPYCVLWHFLGVMFIGVDALMMPVTIAWNLSMTPGDFQFILFWTMLVYWSVDVPTTFLTGYYKGGKLVDSKKRVAKHYFRGWFLFDAAMLCLDATFVLTESGRGLRALRPLRALRILRLLRLLRFVKLQAILYALEDLCSLQAQWIILAVAIIKIFSTIVLSVHFLACLWYLIGRWRSEKGHTSWLEQLERDYDEEIAEYLAAFHWVLGQFTPAPVKIHSSNPYELGFNICVIFFALLVMGSSISKMSASIAQLKSVTWDSTRQRMQLRTYLRSEKVPLDLAARIMNFADFLLHEKAPKLDASLLTPDQKRQVVLCKRRKILMPHPLFDLIHTANMDVFCNICNAFDRHVHQEQSVIFFIGSRASRLHITLRGEFTLDDGRGFDDNFHDSRFFAELSLFMNMLHQSSLKASSHAETFTLTSPDFEQALTASPSCSLLVCEYARGIASKLAEVTNDQLPFELAREVCRKTQMHQIFNLKPELEIHQFVTSSNCDSDDDVPIDLCRLFADDVSNLQMHTDMQALFPEIAETTGLFALYAQPEERNRAVASMFSVVWLIRNQYDAFVLPQARNERMSEALWQELQQFMRWIGATVTSEMLQAVFVFLAIRGLHKVQVILQQLPASCQRSQEALIHIIGNYPKLVPSVMRLSADARNLVEETLMLHQEFNLAQFVQAENLPVNIAALQRFTKESDILLKCYLLSFLGMMAGLHGAPGGSNLYGSRFLNEQNGRSLLLCLNSLKQLFDGTPSAIYWNYVVGRGKRMHLPSTSLKDLTLLRLMCVSRAQSPAAMSKLQEAFGSLGPSDQNLLIEAFVADGINEPGFIFMFLPLCFQRAQENSAVGLRAMLFVLAELVNIVNTRWCSGPAVGSVTRVDLQDLANFTDSVRNGLIFQTCIERSSLRHTHDGLHLMMTTRNWSLVDSIDAPGDSVNQTLRQILRCVQTSPPDIQVQADTLDLPGNELLRTLSARMHAHQAITFNDLGIAQA